MIFLLHILTKVIVYISIRIHPIFEDDSVPINSSVICVFYCVIIVTASDIVPRISHCQSVNSSNIESSCSWSDQWIWNTSDKFWKNEKLQKENRNVENSFYNL